MARRWKGGKVPAWYFPEELGNCCAQLRGAQKVADAVAQRNRRRGWRLDMVAARERVKLRGEGFGRTTALSGILGKAGSDQVIEGCGYRRVGMGRRKGRGGENERANTLQRIGVEGPMAGGHFVHDHAQRKNVRAGVLGLADKLLGAPVSRRAQQRAVFGVTAGEAGHAEVGELDAAVVGNEDVGGLDVA